MAPRADYPATVTIIGFPDQSLPSPSALPRKVFRGLRRSAARQEACQFVLIAYLRQCSRYAVSWLATSSTMLDHARP
jgi:hypothetical protein